MTADLEQRAREFRKAGGPYDAATSEKEAHKLFLTFITLVRDEARRDTAIEIATDLEELNNVMIAALAADIRMNYATHAQAVPPAGEGEAKK